MYDAVRANIKLSPLAQEIFNNQHFQKGIGFINNTAPLYTNIKEVDRQVLHFHKITDKGMRAAINLRGLIFHQEYTIGGLLTTKGIYNKQEMTTALNEVMTHLRANLSPNVVTARFQSIAFNMIASAFKTSAGLCTVALLVSAALSSKFISALNHPKPSAES